LASIRWNLFVGEKVVVENKAARPRTFAIEVARTGEGVWAATSEVVPGLNIEGDTFEEAVAEARSWAPDLLRANGIVAADESVHLVFSRVDQPLSLDK
jgi:predicted RNase H-like HicB family nuclease